MLPFVTIGPPDNDTLGMSGNGGGGHEPHHYGDQKNSRLPMSDLHLEGTADRSMWASGEHYPRLFQEASASLAM
jgi:hypothetical protein